MKHLTIIMSAVLLVSFGCRKEEPATLPNNGVMVESHCSNGVMDGDEDGVDCGPTCGPCALSIADCGGIQPTNNTFTSTQGASLTFTAGNVVADTSLGYLRLRGDDGSRFVVASFSSTTPAMFSAYSVSSTSQGNLTANEVKLQYFDGSGYYNGYTDQLHLNRVSGQLSIEFCDVYFDIPTGGYMLGDGKLTEN